MTSLLTIMILLFVADNVAILYLLDAVQFLIEQNDVIDILLEMRREKEND